MRAPRSPSCPIVGPASPPPRRRSWRHGRRVPGRRLPLHRSEAGRGRHRRGDVRGRTPVYIQRGLGSAEPRDRRRGRLTRTIRRRCRAFALRCRDGDRIMHPSSGPTETPDVENARTAGMKRDGEHRKAGAGTTMNRRTREETGKGPALGPIGWTDVEWPPGNAVEIHHELLDAGDREGAAKWLADVSVDVLAQQDRQRAPAPAAKG